MGEFSWQTRMWKDLGCIRKVAEQAREASQHSLHAPCLQVPALPSLDHGLHCELNHSASSAMFYLSNKETQTSTLSLVRLPSDFLVRLLPTPSVAVDGSHC